MAIHGEKVGKDLYFCMWRITEETYTEFEKLAKAVSGTHPFLKNFEWMAKALNCTYHEAEKKLNVLSKGGTKEYSQGGASALLEIFETFEKKRCWPFLNCYLACLSCTKPEQTFSFQRDACNIEIMVSVLSASTTAYTIHLGVQRSLCYALANKPFHPNLSMLLHGLAASYMQAHYPEKHFMVTNPLESMHAIFSRCIPKDEQLQIKNYNLSPMNQRFGILNGDTILHIMGLEAMEAMQHFAVSLEVLAQFAKPLSLQQSPSRSIFFSFPLTRLATNRAQLNVPLSCLVSIGGLMVIGLLLTLNKEEIKKESTKGFSV